MEDKFEGHSAQPAWSQLSTVGAHFSSCLPLDFLIGTEPECKVLEVLISSHFLFLMITVAVSGDRVQ